MRTRLLTSDSTFSTSRARRSFQHLGEQITLDSQPAVSVYDDSIDSWFGSDEHATGEHAGHYQPGWFNVNVSKTGTKITVVKVDRRTGVMTVKVGRSG